MPTIVFLIYHGKSHFNACVKLAKALTPEYKVVFAGVEFFRNHVLQLGFTFYGLKTVPFGIGLEEWYNETIRKTPIFLNTLKAKWNDQLYKLREAELHQLIKSISPEIILLDAHQATDFVILYEQLKKHAIRLGIIHTSFPVAIQDDLPPLSSLALPNNEIEIQQAVHIARQKRKHRLWIQKMKYLGMDDHTLIMRRLRKNKIPQKYISHLLTYYGVTLKTIPEFVLAPKEFDFKIDGNRSQSYIGFQFDKGRVEHMDIGFFQIWNTIVSLKNTHDKKIIYCSFGTLPLTDKNRVAAFLKKLIATTLQLHHTLVISSAIAKEELLDIEGDDIYIFNEVPQLTVLTQADLFITHGGLNSIKEAIHFEVPMLVYPMETRFDQPGNSSRVVYHQLGLRGELDEKQEELTLKIKTLLTDPNYKTNIQNLKQADLSYATETFLSLLKQIPVVD